MERKQATEEQINRVVKKYQSFAFAYALVRAEHMRCTNEVADLIASNKNYDKALMYQRCCTRVLSELEDMCSEAESGLYEIE